MTVGSVGGRDCATDICSVYAFIMEVGIWV